uniref:Uncharacterized protein n=1 Tax=Arundo donax TaxID=35708 RepID=A0A0A9EAR0_ARUDO
MERDRQKLLNRACASLCIITTDEPIFTKIYFN